MNSRPAHDGHPRRKARGYSKDLRSLAHFLWERGKTLTNATEKDAAAWVRALQRTDQRRKHRMARPVRFTKLAAARGFFEKVGAALNPFARYKTRRSDRNAPARDVMDARSLSALAR